MSGTDFGHAATSLDEIRLSHCCDSVRPPYQPCMVLHVKRTPVRRLSIHGTATVLMFGVPGTATFLMVGIPGTANSTYVWYTWCSNSTDVWYPWCSGRGAREVCRASSHRHAG
eukprot:3941709-Rhodomonas_salina.1